MSQATRRRSARVQAQKVIEVITIESSNEEPEDEKDSDYYVHLSSSPPSSPVSVEIDSPPISKALRKREVANNYNDEEFWRRKVYERRLKLENIIGAVRDKEVIFIVKWCGLDQLEKVPLKVLKKFYCHDLFDYFVNHLKWVS